MNKNRASERSDSKVKITIPIEMPEVREQIEQLAAHFERKAISVRSRTKRRLDNFLPTTRQAVESKNTYLTARKQIINQIQKDSYLLQQGTLSEIIWVIFQGGSPKVLSLLEMHNIRVIEFHDNFEKEIRSNDEQSQITIIEAD